jgi:DNA repair protein SbcD/Mre11
VRFVLFSDLHLESAFAWAQPAVARRRRQALRDTLQRVVSLADAVQADALLCGGDLYEHERSTPDTAAFLREILGGAGRPVYIAPGNHDWFGPHSVYAQVRWPSSVTVFAEATLTPVALEDGLTLWGAAHRAPANTDGFLEGFAVDRGGVNIALFHGSERSGLAQEADAKQPHAPFDGEQIPVSGLDHALLGHHHRPRDAPHHTYPGNPDPLTFGEDGVRGAVVIDIADDGNVHREWHRVNVSEVHDLVVDVTGCTHRDAIRERIVEQLAGRDGTARVTISGELDPGVDLAPAALCDVEHGLDQVVVRTGSLSVGYDLDAIASEQTVRGRFVRDVRAARDLHDDERRRVLLTGLRALEGREDLEVA